MYFELFFRIQGVKNPPNLASVWNVIIRGWWSVPGHSGTGRSLAGEHWQAGGAHGVLPLVQGRRGGAAHGGVVVED